MKNRLPVGVLITAAVTVVVFVSVYQSSFESGLESILDTPVSLIDAEVGQDTTDEVATTTEVAQTMPTTTLSESVAEKRQEKSIAATTSQIAKIVSHEQTVIVTKKSDRSAEIETARQLLSGETTLDDVEEKDIDLEISDFVTAQNLPRTLLLPIDNDISVTTSQNDGAIGVSIASTNKDVLNIYAFDESGNFAGPFFFPQSDGGDFGIVAEEISSVRVGSSGDGISYTIFSHPSTVFLYLVGMDTQLAQIRLSHINTDKHFTISFPVSPRTRGTIILNRTNDSVTINKWNFDFNGDGVTDMSIGNKDYFTKADYEKAFDLIANDKKVSDEDRKDMAAWKDSFMEMADDFN